jgi:hypothetical protein
METKICQNKKCKNYNIELDKSNFIKDKRTKTGLSNWCKECTNEDRNKRYPRYKEKILVDAINYQNENWEQKKVNNQNYEKAPAKWKNYGPKLERYEEIRKDPNDPKLIQVRCLYCGSWTNPTNKQAKHRWDYINGNDVGEGKFYCSDGCKVACPIFNQKSFPKGFAPATSREVQSELRKLVLSRDGYTCQKCDISLEDLRLAGKTLHCHHIDPVINNPIESADVDNCISVCEDCHNDLHRIPGCSNLQC